MTEHDGMDSMSAFLSELIEGWLHPGVRPAASRAAYAEIARAAGGLWAPGDIERAVASANGGTAKAESLSNKFRKMLKDQTVPSLQTLSEVRRAFPSCQAQFWSQHPIFFLLDGRQDESRNFARVAASYALDSLRGPIRAKIWRLNIDCEPWTGRLLRSLDDRGMREVLGSSVFAELAPVERLTLATAVAKMAFAEEHWRAYHQAVRITSAEFSEAVATTNPLLVGWPWLLKLYLNQLWQPHNARCATVDRISTNHQADLGVCVAIARQYGHALPPDDVFELARLKDLGAPDAV